MPLNRILIALLLILGILSCHSAIQDENEGTNDPVSRLSVEMADTIMSNHPQLVYYNRDSGDEKLQYDVAMIGMAIDRLGSVDEKYSIYLKDYIDFFVDSTGSILRYKIKEYNLDRVNFAKNLITLYKRTGDQKYRIAIEEFVRQIEEHPRTKSGGFWHKEVYPWQMWLDGTYMALPFITQYAKEFNRPEWFDLAAFQLTHMYEKTVDQKTGLLYHAWDESKQQRWCDPETGRSKEFWGRSIGWYMMAVVDVLDYLPENHPQRPEIIENFKNLSEALLRVRDEETGVWYQILDKGGQAGNYLEASCTAMYAYSFAKGAKHEYLPAEYFKTAQEVFEAMLGEFVVTDATGRYVIKNICGGCGLGGNPYRDGSYEYYISEDRVLNDPKGIGAFILAAIELNN